MPRTRLVMIASSAWLAASGRALVCPIFAIVTALLLFGRLRGR